MSRPQPIEMLWQDQMHSNINELKKCCEEEFSNMLSECCFTFCGKNIYSFCTTCGYLFVYRSRWEAHNSYLDPDKYIHRFEEGCTFYFSCLYYKWPEAAQPARNKRNGQLWANSPNRSSKGRTMGSIGMSDHLKMLYLIRDRKMLNCLNCCLVYCKIVWDQDSRITNITCTETGLHFIACSCSSYQIRARV